MTASAALASGRYTPTTLIPSPASIVLPGTRTTLSNFNGKPCGNGQVTLAEALAVSCNTAFANIGIDLGGDALLEQAEAYGFNSSFEVPMRAATSRFPTDINDAQTAQSAIGPVRRACHRAADGDGRGRGRNRGVVMRPYLVQDVRAPDLAVLDTTRPGEFGRALTPSSRSRSTRHDGRLVVEIGHRQQRADPGGAAWPARRGRRRPGEGRPPDAWFVAFAPADDPQVAVAVASRSARPAVRSAGTGWPHPSPRR